SSERADVLRLQRLTVKNNFCSNCKRILIITFEFYFQKCGSSSFTRPVSKHERLLIDVVYHEVKVTIIVEITVGGAVGKRRLVRFVFRIIAKSKVAIVHEYFVSEGNGWHFVYDPFDFNLSS